MDIDESGNVSRKHMRDTLGHMNSTASFFGDMHLTDAALDALVDEVREEPPPRERPWPHRLTVEVAARADF